MAQFTFTSDCASREERTAAPSRHRSVSVTDSVEIRALVFALLRLLLLHQQSADEAAHLLLLLLHIAAHRAVSVQADSDLGVTGNTGEQTTLRQLGTTQRRVCAEEANAAPAQTPKPQPGQRDQDSLDQLPRP